MPCNICFINCKSGVSKASLVVNAVASLAQTDKRVLLVDLDTQSNSSIWLMRLDRWNNLNVDRCGSVYSLFEPGEQRLKDIIVKDVICDQGDYPVIPGLDVAPTMFNLVDLEEEHRGDPAPAALSC